MKVLVSGSSGLVGRALVKALEDSGNQVVALVRDKKKSGINAIFWDPEKGVLDSASLEGFDAVVNLSGANIGDGRWTESRKREIRDSRIQSTKNLVDALSRLNSPPKVLVSASAIGIYGNRAEEVCTEETSAGTGFLADLCRQWEAEALRAEQKGIRVVLLRTGIVLSTNGGALSKMLPPFRLYLGGKIGSGEQYMSWISLDDLIGIIQFAITNGDVKGPINATAPEPITNEEFTQVLGKCLERPTVLLVPEFMLRLGLGEEMANETVLASTRVDPKKLIELGYTFKHPELKEAILDALKEEKMKMGTEEGKSDKSFVATLLFCILLGTLGVHRFYVGKIGTGILMLITLGGFGIWWLIDLIMIIAMRFRDKKGLLIEP